jgi:hypothetical protein
VLVLKNYTPAQRQALQAFAKQLEEGTMSSVGSRSARSEQSARHSLERPYYDGGYQRYEAFQRPLPVPQRHDYPRQRGRHDAAYERSVIFLFRRINAHFLVHFCVFLTSVTILRMATSGTLNDLGRRSSERMEPMRRTRATMSNIAHTMICRKFLCAHTICSSFI